MVVVFLDTFERLTLDSRRVDERHVNSLVHSMPNILFVISGRKKLDWHRPQRTNLYRVGSRVWPGLSPQSLTDDICQFEVRGLAEEDAGHVIIRGIHLLGIDIPPDVVQGLVLASGGLPGYLRLALVLASTIYAENGRAVTVADVTGSVDDLVLRVLDDVPLDEQRALRTAALFAGFDPGLLAAGAGVDLGVAKRAASRPMVDYSEGQTLPFQMHEEIRASIRSASAGIAGGWSKDDWRRAGTKALAEIRRRYVQAVENEDDRASVATLGLAIQLVCEQEVAIEPSVRPHYVDWIVEACALGSSPAGLRVHIPAASRTDYGQPILDFVLAKTFEIPSEQSRLLLQTISSSTHPLSVLAGRSLAYSLRNAGMVNESLMVWEDLIGRQPSELHFYQRALTLGAARRFQDAVDTFKDVSQRGRASLRATYDMTHGSVSDWLILKPTQVEGLRAQGKRREYLEGQANLYMWSALFTGGVDVSEMERLLAQAESVAQESATRDCLCALALGLGPHHPASDYFVERLLDFDAETSSSGFAFRSALVLGSRAFVRGDGRELRKLQVAIGKREVTRTQFWIPVEFLFAGSSDLSVGGWPLTGSGVAVRG